MNTFSCIIPAYNEEKGIGHTLSIVSSLIGSSLLEVIVIDDGSKDKTKEIVKEYPKVILLENANNIGKSASVAKGIGHAKGEYVFLLDAELGFLSEKDILDLIRPINEGAAQVSISMIKNAWPLFPFKSIDYLSGQRILPKNILTPHLNEMKHLPSYGLEVFLNKIIIRNNMSLRIVRWPEVENVFNQNKRGWAKGVLVIARIWLNVLRVISPIEMYSQNIKMLRLRV